MVLDVGGVLLGWIRMGLDFFFEGEDAELCFIFRFH